MRVDYRIFLMVFAGLMNAAAYAAEASKMDAFYSDPENIRMFEFSVASGQVATGLEKMANLCAGNTVDNQSVDCGCWKREVRNVSDKEFFYESILSFRQFQERKQALLDNDRKRFEELKALHGKRVGMLARLKSSCEI